MNKLFNRSLTVLTLSLALCALSSPTLAFQSLNGVLADDQGHTLYVFDVDPPSLNEVSGCQGGCLRTWPVALRTAIGSQDHEYTSFSRPEGEQLVYNGRRTYYYAQDRNPGDKLGDGLGGVWHVIQAE